MAPQPTIEADGGLTAPSMDTHDSSFNASGVIIGGPAAIGTGTHTGPINASGLTSGGVPAPSNASGVTSGESAAQNTVIPSADNGPVNPTIVCGEIPTPSVSDDPPAQSTNVCSEVPAHGGRPVVQCGGPHAPAFNVCDLCLDEQGKTLGRDERIYVKIQRIRVCEDCIAIEHQKAREGTVKKCACLKNFGRYKRCTSCRKEKLDEYKRLGIGKTMEYYSRSEGMFKCGCCMKTLPYQGDGWDEDDVKVWWCLVCCGVHLVGPVNPPPNPVRPVNPANPPEPAWLAQARRNFDLMSEWLETDIPMPDPFYR